MGSRSASASNIQRVFRPLPLPSSITAHRWREMLDDGSGMAAEESQLGTRQPIFRQQGDRFK